MDVDRPEVRAALIALERSLIELHEGSREAAEAGIIEAIGLLHPAEVDVEWDEEAA